MWSWALAEMTEKKDNFDRTQASDETLFSRFKNGDQESFEVLLKRYQGPIFSFIMKSVRDVEVANDVFQDVFYKVIDKRELFHPTISFKAWLYTLTRNTCIDRARKKKRTPNMGSLYYEENSSAEERYESGEPQPEENVVESQLDNFLEEALETLSEEQRETFYLKVKNELTFEEIGEAMNCSVNTAKSRMRYALEHLRPLFLKRGYLK